MIPQWKLSRPRSSTFPTRSIFSPFSNSLSLIALHLNLTYTLSLFVGSFNSLMEGVLHLETASLRLDFCPVRVSIDQTYLVIGHTFRSHKSRKSAAALSVLQALLQIYQCSN